MDGFRHRALFYEGRAGFLSGVVPFLREGLDEDAAMLVVVAPDRIAALRRALGGAADRVRFADMGEVGLNPARIIPAWEAFVREPDHSGRPLRGVGEPIWAGRGPAELVECQLHESLLNVAFAEARDFILLCPYDVSSLGHGVLREAHCSHPGVVKGGVGQASDAYRGDAQRLAPFDLPLPRPAVTPAVLAFDRRSLDVVRHTTADRAAAAGMTARRAADLVLAVNEVATNSLRHGGGRGVLRTWCEPGSLICEIRDGGHIRDPLVGRRSPRPGQLGGWGVWTANQVADLVQVRSAREGTVVRVHMRAGAPGPAARPAAA